MATKFLFFNGAKESPGVVRVTAPEGVTLNQVIVFSPGGIAGLNVGQDVSSSFNNLVHNGLLVQISAINGQTDLSAALFMAPYDR